MKKTVPLGILAVASLALNVALFLRLNASQTTVLYRETPSAAQTSQQKSEDDSDQIVERVRRLMDIPNDAPTVATVSDPDKLAGQPFFSNAKVGDKVLIFSTGKKVILYDPVADKVVNVAPLNVNSATEPKGMGA